MLSPCIAGGGVTESDRAAVRTVFLLDGGGASNMAIDASSGVVNYSITAPAGKKYVIYRIIVHIRDNTFSAENYLTAPLVNGISLDYTQGGDTISFLGDQPVKSIGEWARHGVTVRHDYPTGQMYLTVRMDLSAYPIVLMPAESLTCPLNDDLSAASRHRISVHMDIQDV